MVDALGLELVTADEIDAEEVRVGVLTALVEGDEERVTVVVVTLGRIMALEIWLLIRAAAAVPRLEIAELTTAADEAICDAVERKDDAIEEAIEDAAELYIDAAIDAADEAPLAKEEAAEEAIELAAEVTDDAADDAAVLDIEPKAIEVAEAVEVIDIADVAVKEAVLLMAIMLPDADVEQGHGV
ncbi:hypothetical protein CAC42_6158 [Sphaceloma murrayae]|uniref:Uncharacterized protein n=1 Tax=Sphaceloma murrayae TaxID=2082308 RepID=A0A2K1QTI5_9PEZI|nr:hypothetical protein CAC42_6158 [Sphaceloma murrayae]